MVGLLGKTWLGYWARLGWVTGQNVVGLLGKTWLGYWAKRGWVAGQDLVGLLGKTWLGYWAKLLRKLNSLSHRCIWNRLLKTSSKILLEYLWPTVG